MSGCCTDGFSIICAAAFFRLGYKGVIVASNNIREPVLTHAVAGRLLMKF